MREIKFRAWDKNKKEMNFDVLAGGGNPNDDNWYCPIVYSDDHQDWVNFDEHCGYIMQYTGLKDGNDVEIYEHDILEDLINKKRYEVIWDGYGMFLFNPIGTEGNAIDYYEFEDEASTAGTIIVGNRFENPGLLGEES